MIPISRREALVRAGAAAAALGGGRTLTAATNPPAPAASAPVVRDEVDLTDGRLRVVVSPSDGAGLLAFALRRGERWINLYPDVRDPAWKMRYASWMMIPYSNRVENGEFRFQGRTYTLRNGANHAIHGDGRNRSWTVAEKSAARIRLTLRSADFADFNWPWPIEVDAAIALEDGALVQRLRLVNRGDTAMPAGFGWHPYYPRALTREGEPVRLQAVFTGVYPDANGDCIPDGPATPLPEDLDYSKGREIPKDRRYDTCLQGYDGKGTIEWPESGVKLAYDCSAHMTHFVYFNPIERPVWAAEPAANANNGVNLLDRGYEKHGVIVLPAGEALDAHFITRVTA
jgi:aldose 1-epimerase